MEKENLRVLLVDSHPEDRLLILKSFAQSGVVTELKIESTTEKALKRLSTANFDLILSDHLPPHVNALKLLRTLKERGLETPVILLTREGEIQTAREIFKRGAHDWLLKEELEAVSLAEVISAVFERLRQAEDFREFHQQLRARAERDGLTGLYNHRYFLETLEREFLRARRHLRPLSLLVLDLDAFKVINDTCGHPKGDRVLMRIAQILQDSVRTVDLVARYGGDEFVILLPETNPQDAEGVAQRILKEIERNPFLDGNQIYPITASIGIASYHPGQTGPGALFQEADQALYEAKRGGRNQVIQTIIEIDPSGANITHPASESRII